MSRALKGGLGNLCKERKEARREGWRKERTASHKRGKLRESEPEICAYSSLL